MPSPFPISPRHHIILIEGLYTLFTLPGWKECAEMMDVGIWVESERSVVRERLVRRNFAAGIVDDQEKCKQRGESSFANYTLWILLRLLSRCRGHGQWRPSTREQVGAHRYCRVD